MDTATEPAPVEEFATRYERIEKANESSDYMNDPNRPFTVFMSMNSVGDARANYNAYVQDEETLHAIKEIHFSKRKVGRQVIGGNMSNISPYGPLVLSEERRQETAVRNMDRYLRSLNIDPRDVIMLNPDRDYTTKLNVVNADAQELADDRTGPTRLDERGDFIYTYNPNVILGVRPADCPLVVASAETPKGKIYAMVHFAWQGAATQNSGVEQMAKGFEELGVDFSTLSIYVTPGGHSESFPYEKYPQNPHEKYPGTEDLFIGVAQKEDGYSFGIDTPNYIYKELLKLGLDEKQIFVDTSDTSALDSGYSSNGRSARLQEDNTRDLVIVQFNNDPATTHESR